VRVRGTLGRRLARHLLLLPALLCGCATRPPTTRATPRQTPAVARPVPPPLSAPPTDEKSTTGGPQADQIVEAMPLAIAGKRTYTAVKTGRGRPGLAVGEIVEGAAEQRLLALLDVDAGSVVCSPTGTAFVTVGRSWPESQLTFFADALATGIDVSVRGTHVHFSPDGATLFTAGEEAVEVRDGRTGALRFGTPGCAVHGTSHLTPLGDYVVSEDGPFYQNEASLLVLDMERRERVACETQLGSSATSSSGRFVATVVFGGDDATVGKLKVRVLDREKKTDRGWLLDPASLDQAPGVELGAGDRVIVSAREPPGLGQRYAPSILATFDAATGRRVPLPPAGARRASSSRRRSAMRPAPRGRWSPPPSRST
jgi:hypothetical protein